MNTLPTDFVSLPIIITDYDALTDAKSHVKAPTVEIQRSHTATNMDQTADSGIIESAEEIWGRISDAMKNKVREACLEVLRRTEVERSEKDNMSFQYDDDARFLD